MIYFQKVDSLANDIVRFKVRTATRRTAPVLVETLLAESVLAFLVHADVRIVHQFCALLALQICSHFFQDLEELAAVVRRRRRAALFVVLQQSHQLPLQLPHSLPHLFLPLLQL